MPSRRRRVLVTGLESFTGAYLFEVLSEAGYEVHGTVKRKAEFRENLHIGNLCDSESLSDLIRTVSPHYVVHLAAVSFVDHENISEIYQTNITGTRNLLSSLAKFPHITRQLRTVLLASSASVYGNSQSDPISEATPFSPGNDYAVSKVAMELMAANWANRLPITVVRPFNYTGVGQSEKFIVPKIVRAFTKKDDVIELGNVDVYRDFLDVRDVADVYLQLLESSPRGVFNICSEKVQTLRDIISTVSLLSGHAAEIRVKSHLIRASDAKIMWGSAARLRAVVPLWAPRPFTETLTWMLEQAPKISL